MLIIIIYYEDKISHLNGKCGLHHFSGVTPPSSPLLMNAIMAFSINRPTIFEICKLNNCSYAVIYSCEKASQQELAFKQIEQEMKSTQKRNPSPAFKTVLIPN